MFRYSGKDDKVPRGDNVNAEVESPIPAHEPAIHDTSTSSAIRRSTCERHRLWPLEVEADAVSAGAHHPTPIRLLWAPDSLDAMRRPNITSHSASKNSPMKLNDETGVDDPWVSAALMLSKR